MSQPYHVPVMLQACIDGLNIQADGTYVDLTFGGGGHSKRILEHLTSGKLYAFDQDEDAEQNAKQLANENLIFIRANFRHLERYLKLYGIQKVDGILGDLGISSYQIDTPTRGFSTRFDGDLDMRMDTNNQLTAKKVINGYPEKELQRILGMYGEVKNAKTLAKALVSRRINTPFQTIEDLKHVLLKYAPRNREFRYFAQVFQAIRIAVNQELDALQEVLIQSQGLIKPDGRLVILTYHSLEDRLVKNFIQKGKFHGDVEQDFYGNIIKPFEAINRKPIVASPEEVAQNKRARSAKLRVAKRLQGI